MCGPRAWARVSANGYWGGPGSRVWPCPLDRPPLGTQGQSDTHHVGHVLNEDLAAKFYSFDHISRHVCPQAPLLSHELLQTHAGEDLFRADVHGPGLQASVLPWELHGQAELQRQLGLAGGAGAGQLGEAIQGQAAAEKPVEHGAAQAQALVLRGEPLLLLCRRMSPAGVRRLFSAGAARQGWGGGSVSASLVQKNAKPPSLISVWLS